MRKFEYVTNDKQRIYGSAVGAIIARLILDHDRFHFSTWNQASATLALVANTALASLAGVATMVLVILAVQFSLNQRSRVHNPSMQATGFDQNRN